MSMTRTHCGTLNVYDQNPWCLWSKPIVEPMKSMIRTHGVYDQNPCGTQGVHDQNPLWNPRCLWSEPIVEPMMFMIRTHCGTHGVYDQNSLLNPWCLWSEPIVESRVSMIRTHCGVQGVHDQNPRCPAGVSTKATCLWSQHLMDILNVHQTFPAYKLSN